MSVAVEPLTGNLGWLLSQASYVLTTQLAAALEEVGLTPRSYCLLSKAMTGEYTQIELAHAIGLDKTTMVVTLDELEAAGLAERRRSSTDRRARVVAVTPAGKRKVAKGEQIVERTQAEVLATLASHERQAFMDALAQLVCGRLSTPAECAHTVRRRAGR